MPYIMIDAAGIKQLFQTNRQAAIDKCQQFWELIKVTALHDVIGSRYVTFSDSALIHIPKDGAPAGAQLVNWLRTLLNGLHDKTKTEFYAIANSGFEAGPSMLHDITATRIDSNYEPHYVHIAGLGDDFTDLFLAEEEIRKQRRAGSIPSTARIYVKNSLLTAVEIGSHKQITVGGLSGVDQIFICME